MYQPWEHHDLGCLERILYHWAALRTERSREHDTAVTGDSPGTAPCSRCLCTITAHTIHTRSIGRRDFQVAALTTNTGCLDNSFLPPCWFFLTTAAGFTLTTVEQLLQQEQRISLSSYLASKLVIKVFLSDIRGTFKSPQIKKVILLRSSTCIRFNCSAAYKEDRVPLENTASAPHFEYSMIFRCSQYF